MVQSQTRPIIVVAGDKSEARNRQMEHREVRSALRNAHHGVLSRLAYSKEEVASRPVLGNEAGGILWRRKSAAAHLFYRLVVVTR